MIPPILPTTAELQPFLAKLEASSGSVVLIAITWNRDGENYAKAEVGFFNADARARLKRAIRAEKRRAQS
jgi:hypothetical protein